MSRFLKQESLCSWLFILNIPLMALKADVTEKHSWISNF